MKPLLSVIIPVYNEADTVIQIIEAVDLVKIDKEIIVVDDGSNDGTGKKLRDIDYNKFRSLKIIHHSDNRGKGAAFLTGLLNASGEFVIIQDADLEYNPGDYHILVDYVKNNNVPVVYGSRFLSGQHTFSTLQYVANKVLTFITNLLFNSSLTDMETCYKLVKREVLSDLRLEAKKFEIEPEITIKLLRKGFKINEVPISYCRRSYTQGKKIGWIDGFETLCCILRLRFLS